MGLSASMWTGVSGLLAHGSKMNTIGNNIANVSTYGYKASVMQFEDAMYQYTSTTAQSFGQVGRGVNVAAIYGDFSQGSFETTNEATDMAISGNGFFGVVDPTSGKTYYTRAGNMRFDSDGYLVDPHGYRLQGWVMDQTGSSTTSTSAVRGVGAPTDILLEGFTSSPRHTTRLTAITNLDSEDGGDNTSDPANPAFSLLESWNALEDPPLGDSEYAYQTSIVVYDEGGGSHTLTVYYDRVSNSSNTNLWEYIVTMDPDEDMRTFNNGSYSLAGTSSAGLLMAGTMTFSSAGELTDMTAYTLAEGTTNASDLSSWMPTAISDDGYPVFAANFSGLSNASWVIDSSGNEISPVLSNADGKLIEFNIGISVDANFTWSNAGQSAASVGTNLSLLGGMGTESTVAALASTGYDGSSSTTYSSQDGYSYGYLESVSIDSDGILSGTYSNGVTLELYQITLYDFQNYNGLRREGGNLFSQTLESGEAVSGAAGSNGLGDITSNSLEQSNVDLATEFVQMISTQRGFSANGKVITTTDEMLAEVISLKR